MKVLRNPHRQSRPFQLPSRAPLAFHRTMPGYAPTRLERLDAAILAKIEHPRFGLPAFKILGASWAIARAMALSSGSPVDSWDELLAAAHTATAAGPVSLAAATDGNHGRAVARVAALLGMESRIFVPDSISAERRTDIEREGAQVEVVAGNYDFAVHRAMSAASPRCLIISDVMLEEGDPVPGWVIEGYATMLWELELALSAQRLPQPDVVLVQIGVGALAAAVVRHYRRPDAPRPVVIVGVEPLKAACALESILRGVPSTLPSSAESAMAGLNCEAPSLAAWPELFYGIDTYIAIEDRWAFRAMRAFAESRIEAGESGAAGLAGWMAAAASEDIELPANPNVLVLVTEGATDQAAYARVLQDDADG